MSYAAYAPPTVSAAPPDERADYLRKVGLLTFAGLTTAAITSVASSLMLIAFPILLSRWVSLGVMLGSFALARTVMNNMVHADNRTTQFAGFFGGSMFQGVALGYLLLAAAEAGTEVFGNPLVFLVEAGLLVFLIAVGMVAYLATGPRNLSMIGSVMAMASLPMLAIMVISFVFPIGGPLGTLLCVAFVAMSIGGLLYNLNAVIHKLPTSMWIEGAYSVTLGLLVVFWNVLSLLMRMQRRR